MAVSGGMHRGHLRPHSSVSSPFFSRLPLLLLLSLLLLLLYFFYSSNAQTAQMNILTEQLQLLRRNIRTLQAEETELKANLEQLKKRETELTKEMSNAEAEKSECKKELTTLRADCDAQKKTLSELKMDCEKDALTKMDKLNLQLSLCRENSSAMQEYGVHQEQVIDALNKSIISLKKEAPPRTDDKITAVKESRPGETTMDGNKLTIGETLTARSGHLQNRSLSDILQPKSRRASPPLMKPTRVNDQFVRETVSVSATGLNDDVNSSVAKVTEEKAEKSAEEAVDDRVLGHQRYGIVETMKDDDAHVMDKTTTLSSPPKIDTKSADYHEAIDEAAAPNKVLKELPNADLRNQANSQVAAPKPPADNDNDAGAEFEDNEERFGKQPLEIGADPKDI